MSKVIEALRLLVTTSEGNKDLLPGEAFIEWEKMKADLVSLQEENKQLFKALKEYGRHKPSCKINPGGPIMAALGKAEAHVCTCGFERSKEIIMRRISNTPFNGLPASIESSESRGQQELVESEQLPAEISAKDKSVLEAAGVIFGAPIDGDSLFVQATLPSGWKKCKTDHPMWSEIIDEKGKVRAKIFYKAAIYDRKATLYLA